MPSSLARVWATWWCLFWWHYRHGGLGSDCHQRQERCLFTYRCRGAFAGGVAGRGGVGRPVGVCSHGLSGGAAVHHCLEHERGAPLHAYAEKRPRQRCGGAAHLLRADGDFRYGHRGGGRYRAGSRPVHPPNGSTDPYSAPGLTLYRRVLSARGRTLQDERPAVFLAPPKRPSPRYASWTPTFV